MLSYANYFSNISKLDMPIDVMIIKSQGLGVKYLHSETLDLHTPVSQTQWNPRPTGKISPKFVPGEKKPLKFPLRKMEYYHPHREVLI